jgi:hypothetical protein
LFVHRKDLRNIDNARLANATITSFEQDIAWITLSVQIPRQCADYHCIDPASVAGIVLNYYDRTTTAWLRVVRLVEIYPEDILL